jgi:hypothetical protein
MEASKSTEVLHEMIRQMKEEQIPQLRQEITNGLLEIRTSHKEFSEHIYSEVKTHHDRLTALENYKVGQEAQLGVWKWIISIVGISSIAQWVLDISKK